MLTKWSSAPHSFMSSTAPGQKSLWVALKTALKKHNLTIAAGYIRRVSRLLTTNSSQFQKLCTHAQAPRAVKWVICVSEGVGWCFMWGVGVRGYYRLSQRERWGGWGASQPTEDTHWPDQSQLGSCRGGRDFPSRYKYSLAEFYYFWVTAADRHTVGWGPHGLNIHNVPAALLNLETREELIPPKHGCQVGQLHFYSNSFLTSEGSRRERTQGQGRGCLHSVCLKGKEVHLAEIKKPAAFNLLHLRTWREDPAPFTQLGPSAPSCWSLGSDWSWLKFFARSCTIV